MTSSNSAPKPSPTVSWINAGVAMATAAVSAYAWFKTGSSAWIFLAASFLLRAPVSFNHPMTLAKLGQPIGQRPVPREPFSKSNALLSIASFLLLLVAIALFASTLL
jgi:hypothetical protein